MAIHEERRNIGKTALFHHVDGKTAFYIGLYAVFLMAAMCFLSRGLSFKIDPFYGEIIRGCVNREKKAPEMGAILKNDSGKDQKETPLYRGVISYNYS